MHSQLVVAALVASVSASANLFPGHMAIRRDLLVARQTESADTPTATSGGLSDQECQASLLSIATDLPLPEGDLLSWEQENVGMDPCSVTAVPSSLSSQFTSYTNAVLSWYSESSSVLLEAISQCPQYAGAVSEVAVCTSDSSDEATTTATSADATATESGSEASGSEASGSEASATGSATGTGTGTATESGSSDSTGTASGSASSSVETAGAPLREAGIVGAVLAGVLGVAVAL